MIMDAMWVKFHKDSLMIEKKKVIKNQIPYSNYSVINHRMRKILHIKKSFYNLLFRFLYGFHLQIGDIYRFIFG